MEKRRVSDNEWLYIYDKFYKERYEHYRKSGVSAPETIDQAFQKKVDLELHPHFPVQRPIYQLVMV